MKTVAEAIDVLSRLQHAELHNPNSWQRRHFLTLARHLADTHDFLGKVKQRGIAIQQEEEAGAAAL